MKLAPTRRACVSEPTSTIATIVELLFGEDFRVVLTMRAGSFAGFQSTITASSLLCATASRADTISVHTSVWMAKSSRTLFMTRTTSASLLKRRPSSRTCFVIGREDEMARCRPIGHKAHPHGPRPVWHYLVRPQREVAI